jgi:predicted metal-dependent hydrolase
MSEDAPEYDPLYLEGIKHFNVCDFFESHEVWEELWTEYRGPSRKFYQGLIQAAVALFHFGNGNIRGARKLYHSVKDYLEPYRPNHMGLNVDKFMTELTTCMAEVIASTEEFPNIEIVGDLIPEIHLDPAPIEE